MTARGYLAQQLGAGLVKARGTLSQRAQAKALGIAGNTLRELELGLANPTLARIEELANPTLARIEELADALGLKVELRVTRRKAPK